MTQYTITLDHEQVMMVLGSLETTGTMLDQMDEYKIDPVTKSLFEVNKTTSNLIRKQTGLFQ